MLLQFLVYLAWLLIAASAFGCAYLWYASHAVVRFARRVIPSDPAQPAVSILKPLRGEDPALMDNLRSFCRQAYGRYQIVFGVADADDPAVPVIRRLEEEFPESDITLVVEPSHGGANLKIANLRNMLPAARHDVFVLADSDMRVGPDYLTAVVAPIEYGAGLVTCLYRGLSAGGFCSDIASLHINHGFLPQAVVADSLGLGAGCFGATMAFGRETLARTGGFDALADVLADDHELGQAVGRLGLEVVLSPYIVDDIVAEADFGALFRHELRWARTIRLVAPGGFIGSVVTFPVPLAALAVLLGAFAVPPLVMLLLALLGRALTAARIDRALRLNRAPVWILPVRDMLSFGVFIASFFGRGVAWRDHYFRIGPNGQLVLDAKKS